MIRIEHILSEFQAYTQGQVDCSPIQKAYILVAKAQSFVPLARGNVLNTSLETAKVLTDLKLDIQSIVSGLIQGAYCAKKISSKEIRDLMGKETANIVEGVARLIENSEIEDVDQRIAKNMRQMIFETTRDLRILFVKLAVRLVRLRHSGKLFQGKEKELARETLFTFAPIAERLGLSHIKVELEDLSFSFLHPKEFKHIQLFCESKKEEHEALLEQLYREIGALLTENDVQGTVKGRIKHYYSIYRKALRDQVTYENIHDLIGVRVVVGSIGDCYKVHGLLNTLYRPVAERYKDYITYPKPNGYQSLHGMFYTQGGYGFELQIRTRKMDSIAERGVAAHWAYKAGATRKSLSDEEFLLWIQDLNKNLNFTSDPRESLEIFTRELYSDFVYVFTPSGKIIKLPRGSSVLDFAYEIHSQIGNHCVGALINGRKCSIQTILNHGDKVEVLTDKEAEPDSNWLHIATTTRALSQVRLYLRKKEHQEAVKLGEELLSELAKKLEKTGDQLQAEESFLLFLKENKIKDQEELCARIGFGKTNIGDLELYLRRRGLLQVEKAEKSSSIKRLYLPFMKKHEGIRIAGMENAMVHYAKCCNPVKGDPVIGVVTTGQGVTIHWAECVHIKSQGVNPERFVDVEWSKNSSERYQVRLHLQFDDQIRTNFLIMKILDSAKVILLENNLRLVRNISYQDITVTVNNAEQLEKILKKLNGLNSVQAHRKQDPEQL